MAQGTLGPEKRYATSGLGRDSLDRFYEGSTPPVALSSGVVGGSGNSGIYADAQQRKTEMYRRAMDQKVNGRN